MRQLEGEDATVGEGGTTFDVRFEARVPGADGLVRIEVDLEAQSDFDLGYPLLLTRSSRR